MKTSVLAEQPASPVNSHLDLRKRSHPEDLAGLVAHNLSRDEIDRDLFAAPQPGGDEVAGENGQAGVDGVALVDRAEGPGDDGRDAEAFETVDGLLAGRAGPE